jgi:hypothetical protein
MEYLYLCSIIAIAIIIERVLACNTIRCAASFPPIPKEIDKKQLQMQINITFKLK